MSDTRPDAREASTPSAQAGKTRARIVNLLKLALAIALLAFVGTLVPWTDVLLVQRGESTLEVPGEIDGDWKQDAIRFRVSEDFEDSGLDAAAREALAPGTVVAVRRGDEAAPLAGTLGAELDWRPGMPRVFRELDPRGLAIALGLFFCAIATVVTRWWRLLAIADCGTTWFNALRLTFLGLFFNIVFPGLTGGDVVKAVLVVRENPSRRADALMSVIVDRLIGLLALALLAGVMLLFLGDEFAQLRVPVAVFLGVGIVGGIVYSHNGLRRRVGFDRILARLPMGERVRKLDEAFLVYSRRPGELALAAGLSIVNHLCFASAVFALGRAFGDVQPFSNYLAIVPVANIVSSIPIAPGGWGVGEAMYRSLFLLVGADPTVGVAVSITQRLCVMVVGLLGGSFLLLPGGRVRLEEIQEIEPAA